ncbi:MAG: ABC transporter ATP-binding protein [Capsulimonadales bacterium]|nr:ABC transporter ATP-binding protein [Capsulimonadales bacterium]
MPPVGGTEPDAGAGIVESVQVTQLVKKFGDKVVVDNLDLQVDKGEFMVFLGPSGCGKTTTLRCIAGLEIPDGGEIRIGANSVTKLPPAERDIAFVFQSFSLYPHMTVRENLSFPLRAVRTPANVIAERVTAAARSLHIEKLLDRRPNKLSGGEMQRVTIGRAIVRRPQVFLMDEPLSALDAKLRTEMRAEIKRLQSDLGATTIYVTHDQLEAMSMGDKIAIMYGGILQQVGTPTEVYDNPRNLFVAGFIGSPSMNFLPVRREGDQLRIVGTEGASDVMLPIAAEAGHRFSGGTPDRELVLGVRPEDIQLVSTGSVGAPEAEVYVVELLGSENIINLRIAGHIVKARTPPTFRPQVGETPGLRLDQTRSHLFDAASTIAITKKEG